MDKTYSSYYITDHLKWWATQLNVPKEEVSDTLDNVRKQLLTIPQNERLRTALHWIDKFNKNSELAKQSSCRSGCGFCCHQRIMVIEEEVDLIIAYLKFKNIDVDMEQLEKLSKYKKSDYFQNDNKDTRCVFLNEGNQCQIYDVRPSSCRNYFVQSDPKYCNNETLRDWPKGKDYPFSSGVEPNSHFIASALINMSKAKTGSLAKVLYDRLNADT